VDPDDRLVIATPEGLELTLALAGLGSRFIAGAVDLLIQEILAVILFLVAAALGGFLLAVDAIGQFVILLLYPILFEVLGHGRTPGKRLTHLRVLRDDGSPVDLQASAIRNLVRLVDGPLLLYLPTLAGIAATRRNQRPGDMAAGTVVVREPRSARAQRVSRRRRRSRRERAGVTSTATATRTGGGRYGLEASAVTPQELAAVRHFLERRDSLEPRARRDLARRLASGLRDKVGSVPPELGGETFLEALVAERTNQEN
jgi:uncharacterized RDD family membrane protein YckC